MCDYQRSILHLMAPCYVLLCVCYCKIINVLFIYCIPLIQGVFPILNLNNKTTVVEGLGEGELLGYGLFRCRPFRSTATHAAYSLSMLKIGSPGLRVVKSFPSPETKFYIWLVLYSSSWFNKNGVT